MTERKTILTGKAPAPIGPYSQAVLAGNTLYISGQIAINPANGEMVQTDIQAETRQVMENIKSVLAAAGMKLDQVVKATIFITDMGQFAPINEVYGSFFSGSYPARETVEVSKLPKNANVEISVIAVK